MQEEALRDREKLTGVRVLGFAAAGEGREVEANGGEGLEGDGGGEDGDDGGEP